jgi:dTDP-4-dehydrorhamnose reductase/dTDP-4-dehydrorhamnose 3,5-epimerase
MPFAFQPVPQMPDVILIEPRVFPDPRGFFLESYKKSEFVSAGIGDDFVQDNHSRSTRGVLRGLHYQIPPFAQGKLVRCICGAIWDVVVDVRRSSPTFGKWFSLELSAENRKILYVPPGFAHGFLTLSEAAEIAYKVTAEYSAVHDRGILWNDPDIGIEWPFPDVILSEKDARNPNLSDAEVFSDDGGELEIRKIWLVGCNGMLGREIAEALTRSALPFVGTDLELDITDPDAVSRFVTENSFRWIINCAAYTAVDKAEAEPEKAMKVNGDGPGNLAVACRKMGANLIHFSTDYVFDGSKPSPYTEEDEPHPLSVYGRTKREGEIRVLDSGCRAFLFRISWLYGMNGPNFVKTMLRLFSERDEIRVVSDQFGAPTYAATLADNILGLIRSDSKPFGTYHYSDRGRISWFDFAVRIRELALSNGFPVKTKRIIAIPSSEYPTPAMRPKNSTLDKTRVIAELGFKVEDWQRNLEASLRNPCQ